MTLVPQHLTLSPMIARIIDRWFWAFCVSAALIGLLLPEVARPVAKYIKYLLGSILFFTGLKLNFKAALKEIRRPRLVVYVAVVRLLVLPLLIYQAARLLLPPAYAMGVLIVAAMPSGTACSALTDIVRGNPALALVGTIITSLAVPFVAPWIIRIGSGAVASGGASFLLDQVIFLAVILFVPLGVAFGLRRAFPIFINKRRDLWSILSMVSLFTLICGALGSVSDKFKELVNTNPKLAIGLFVFMCCFAATFHIIGFFLAPWRPLEDRVAISVNMAYVNNGLAIVFASQFFMTIEGLGAAAVLPAIFLEIPMALVLIPLKTFMTRRLARDTALNADREQ